MAPPTSVGSGAHGAWALDEFGLPAFDLAHNFTLPGATFGGGVWQSGVQLGNDRFVALLGADNSLSVRQDEGSPKWLNAQWEEPAARWPAGIGWVSRPSHGALLSTLQTTAVPAGGTRRRLGVGYLRRAAGSDALSLQQTLIAPYGDDPVLVSEVTITNKGASPQAGLRYTEAWPNQAAHFAQIFGTMANAAGGSAAAWAAPLFEARHYGASPSQVKRSSRLVGVREQRAWLGLSPAEAAEFDRINQALDVPSNRTPLSGLLPSGAGASVWDRTPPTTFLYSLDALGAASGGNVSGGNDASRFYGVGGAVAPDGLQREQLEWSDQVRCQLPTALREQLAEPPPAAACSALILQRTLPTLAPGEAHTIRLLWGYVAEGGGTASESALVSKYAAAAPGLLSASSKAWLASSLTLEAPRLAGSPWAGSELLWHHYMLRAGGTHDTYFGERILNQGTSYFYEAGLNGAARDPPQHALPLILTQPETAKAVLRTTIRQIVDPASWPEGYTGTLLPYSLMMQGLVYPNKERGPSDLELWLLWALSEYVLLTRDAAFLDEPLAIHVLLGGEQQNTTVLRASLVACEHLMRDVGVGEHGLLRLRTSDWSDVILKDRAAIRFGEPAWFQALAQDESVMNAGLAAFILPRFAQVLALAGMDDEAERVAAFGKAQAEAAVAHAWTGVNADGEGWFKRAFVSSNFTTPALKADRGWLGGFADQLNMDAQPYLVMAGALDEEGRAALLTALDRRVRSRAPFGARQLEKGYSSSTDDAVGDWENGAVWHALSYPLTLALNEIDPEAALDEFRRNSLATHAALFPLQWEGTLSASDHAVSSIATNRTVGKTGVLCLHRHAWPLWAAAKLFARLEPTAEGLLLAPHASLRAERFRFATPLVSLAHDGAGNWSGRYVPSATARADKSSPKPWVLRLHLGDAAPVEVLRSADRPEGGVWRYSAP